VGTVIYPDGTPSPASKALDEAIELSLTLEDRSPYPNFAHFIDTDSPFLEKEIDESFAEGYSAVLVSSDGSFQVLAPPPTAPDPELHSVH
jgi:hypothetical protein